MEGKKGDSDKLQKKRKPADSTVSLDEWLDRDVTLAALHEAGHYLVAKHFGLGVKLRLWRRDGVDPNWIKPTKAYVEVDFQTGFQRCCIGWGGIVAECIRNDPDWLPGMFKMECLDDPESYGISLIDAQSIKSHRQKLRAAYIATAVIRARQWEIHEIIAAARVKLRVEKRSEFKMFAPRSKKLRIVDTVQRWKQMGGR
jgi:hypothetical protein